MDKINQSEILARSLLRDEVVEERRFSIGSAQASIWKNKTERPVARVCVCESGNDTVASLDLDSFIKILQLSRPSLEELASDLELLKSILPFRLRLLPCGRTSIDDETGNQPLPAILEEGLVFYCNDYRNGRVLRLVISKDYRLATENVREGVAMEFL